MQTPDKATRGWYSGEVISARLEGNYGYRVRIKTDVTYNFNGKEYQVYTAYAHLDNIDPNIKEGTRVAQGERIGQMGGTGAGGDPDAYPVHVDLRTWIESDWLGALR